jgi:hypothetical protein
MAPPHSTVLSSNIEDPLSSVPKLCVWCFRWLFLDRCMELTVEQKTTLYVFGEMSSTNGQKYN